MDNVTVELPKALLTAADLDPSNLSEEASRLLALELFREEKISLGRAAQDYAEHRSLCSWSLVLAMVCRPSATASKI